MNKVLRCSIYENFNPLPLTMITRAIDLHVSIEQAAKDLEAVHPGTFVVVEIFNVDPEIYDNELAAVHAGMQRLQDSARALEERNMAICYYWNAMQLRRIAPDGTLANPNRAPLSKAQLETVARQLAKHPDYKGQHVFMMSRDGDVVAL